MNKKFLPWFLLFCAIGLSGTAAYYSVVGLSIIFSTVAIPVIIMGSFLEISKIAIATYLHNKWKETYRVLKIYLTIALVILSFLTSIGIYGLLSTGFQKNIAGFEINNKVIENIEVKKNRFEEIKTEYQNEKGILDKDITNLRNALSTNTTTQSIDKTTGQVITRANGGNRKAFESQLKVAQENRDGISKKIESLNDSITRLDIEVLGLTSLEIESGELGAIKYLSEITGWDVKKTANFFILTLVFVFDPLAIALVISTNQAFKNFRKKEEDEIKPEYEEHPSQNKDSERDTNVPHKEDTIHDEIEIPESYLTHHTPQVDPQVQPIVIEKIVEVERIVEVVKEVPFDRIVEIVREVPVDRIVELVREVPVEKLVEVLVEVPYKYYVDEKGQVYDENGSLMEGKIIKKKLEEMERKILKYKK
jgi:hypothetical protein